MGELSEARIQEAFKAYVARMESNDSYVRNYDLNSTGAFRLESGVENEALRRHKGPAYVGKFEDVIRAAVQSTSFPGYACVPEAINQYNGRLFKLEFCPPSAISVP
tara:strand:+ start:2224 stop:2541 length:318 start_codon:yes stop_codon:yes gene_type:complete